MEKNICIFDDKEYSDGSEVCDAIRCMVCRDGEWVASWISDFGL
ncbi:MAG: hypothetical protein WAN11_05720 [Syntrophobacteraceae bacterium]